MTDPKHDLLAAAQPEAFDQLLRGAIDVHVHGQPDLSAGLPNRGADVEVARLAHAYGISGWVLKSHLWATMDRARSVQQAMAETTFTVYGSITLNPPVGGLEVHEQRLDTSKNGKVQLDVRRLDSIARLEENWQGAFRRKILDM